MSNSIICINKRDEDKNSGILCLALIFNLSNLRMTILYAKNWSKVARYDTVFIVRLILVHRLVLKASHSQLEYGFYCH